MKAKELYEAAERWMTGDGDCKDATDVVRAYRDEHRPDDEVERLREQYESLMEVPEIIEAYNHVKGHQ